MCGKSPELPSCIERLIKLKGYPVAREYLPAVRTKLAKSLLDEIARLRERAVRPTMTAANIFVKCQDACVEQVKLLLRRTDISQFDRERLKERRETLRDYSSESLQRSYSGNAAGMERLYRNHKNKIHTQIKCSANIHTVKETEELLFEFEARNHPAIQNAIRIIDAPDVGNHSRSTLLKLQKQTPKWAQPVWADLWDEFHQALSRKAANLR